MNRGGLKPFSVAFSFHHLELLFPGDSATWVISDSGHSYSLPWVIAFTEDPVAQAPHPQHPTPVAKNMFFPEAFVIKVTIFSVPSW